MTILWQHFMRLEGGSELDACHHGVDLGVRVVEGDDGVAEPRRLHASAEGEHIEGEVA